MSALDALGVVLARTLLTDLHVLCTHENADGTFDVMVSREVLHHLRELAEQLLHTAEGSR